MLQPNPAPSKTGRDAPSPLLWRDPAHAKLEVFKFVLARTFGRMDWSPPTVELLNKAMKQDWLTLDESEAADAKAAA